MTKSYSPKLGEQLGGRLSPGMSRTLGLTACAPSPPPPPLSHSLTLYPPSPSVPDRSRPDFMNCKRTVASPSSFAPCTRPRFSSQIASPFGQVCSLSQSGSPTPYITWWELLARSGNHSRMSAARMARLRLPAVFCNSEARWKQLKQGLSCKRRG